MTSTIRGILTEAQARFGPEVAVRYKIGKHEIADKTYNQLREDSESFSNALAALGEQGSHIAVIGPTSYRWMVTYLGTVNSGSVAVPLDASLPAGEVWELLDRADVTTLVADAARKDVAEGAKEHCPKLKHVVLMQQEEMKTYPFGAVWEEYCRRQGVPADESWFAQVLRYEQEVLSKRS